MLLELNENEPWPWPHYLSEPNWRWRAWAMPADAYLARAKDGTYKPVYNAVLGASLGKTYARTNYSFRRVNWRSFLRRSCAISL